MIGQWLNRWQGSQLATPIMPLTVADVDGLQLGWRSVFTPSDLVRHLQAVPGRSFWLPATREYLIGGNWRHRPEIASVVELDARGEPRRLLIEALATILAAEGQPLLVFGDTSELRQPRWYAEIGFELLQEIIVYELNGAARRNDGPPPRLRFEALDDVTAELLTVDHGAFPFLWWNNRVEFESYLDQPGVRLILGRAPCGRAVSYAGLTLFQGWGHLDRLAVLSDSQGQGYGRETLAHAVELVLTSGARRTGLSTQADNRRSQRLYESFGFRRSFRTDYQIYGRWLTDDVAARQHVLGRAAD
jgi:ribosomal protein S18 acetylase RimI-like enzyme